MSQFPTSGELSMNTIATNLGISTSSPYSMSDFVGKTLYNTNGTSYTVPAFPLSFEYFYGRYYTDPYIAPIRKVYQIDGSIAPPSGQIRNPTSFNFSIYGAGGGGGGGGGGFESGAFYNNSSGAGGGGGGGGGLYAYTLNYTGQSIDIDIGIAGVFGAGGDGGGGTGSGGYNADSTGIYINGILFASANGGGGGGGGAGGAQQFVAPGGGGGTGGNLNGGDNGGNGSNANLVDNDGGTGGSGGTGYTINDEDGNPLIIGQGGNGGDGGSTSAGNYNPGNAGTSGTDGCCVIIWNYDI
jgi:hypothetical protein